VRILNYPKTFWILFFTAAALMLAYAFYQNIVVLYLIEHFSLSKNLSYEINGVFSASIYLSGVLGGFLTQYWFKHTQAIVIGLFLLGAGTLATSLPNFHFFILGLAFFTIGYGLVYINGFHLMGTLFALDDPRRESCFTLGYTGLNVGAVLGFALAGFAISQNYLPLCTCLLSIFLFLSGLIFHRQFSTFYSANHLNTKKAIPTGIIIIAIISMVGLLEIANNIQIILSCICLLLLLSVFYIAHLHRKVDKKAAKNLLILGVLSLITVVFWTGYRLQNSLILVFLQQSVERHVFGVLIPSPTIFSINPMVILIVGPLFSLFWLRGRESHAVNPAHKIAIGLGWLMLGFICLFLSTLLNYPAHLSWIVLFLVFLSLGEIIVGPTTLSMVGQLAPSKYQSLLLGIVRTDISAASIFAGQAAVLFNNSLATSNKLQSGYTQIFLQIVIILFVMTLVTVVLSRKSAIPAKLSGNYRS
jgi:POT family proton-dependent oligopeptide transporter